MASKKLVVHQLVGKRFLAINEAGDKVIIDGENPAAGLRPMELLLAALAGCTAYDVVDIMKKKRQPLQHYRVEVEGERAEEHPKRYTKISVTHYGAGPEVTAEALARAAELSHSKYCSVAASLSAPVEVFTVVEAWEDEAQASS
jgi:putative redox protein